MFSPRRLSGAPSSLTARAAAGCLVLAAGLTACGGSGEQGGSGALQSVQGAYDKTTSAGTVKIELTGSQQSGQTSGGQQGKITGQAALDFAQNASSTMVDATGPTASETRTIDDILYRKVPEPQRASVPGKKPWIKVDLAQIAKAQYGKQAGAMLDNPPSDPAGMLGYLQGVTKAQESGTSTIRGTETTHYSAKVDLKKAAEGQGPQIEQRLQQLKQQLGSRPLDLQVWLDEQDRIRRLQTTLPSAQPGASGGLVLTEEFYDYGASVQVNPPAKGDTADVTQQILQQQKMREQMQRMQQQQQQQSP